MIPVRAARASNDEANANADLPEWWERTCVIVPALDAERTLPRVIDELRSALSRMGTTIFVVDDGSTDGTRRVAEALGCEVISHRENRGKGAALQTGFRAALARGFDVALTVDADGQHPGEDARRVLLASPDPEAFVLGIRDLARAGAPRKNRMSNGISNYFLSRFAGRALADTQCGLRRYPIRRTLMLGATGSGYEFEGEVLLQASWAGVPIVEAPIAVRYPDDRVTHFRVSRDPWRILRTVVTATIERRIEDLRGRTSHPRRDT